MSLTTCLKRAKEALAPEHHAAIVARVKQLRSTGMKGAEAGKQAVNEQIQKVEEMLRNAPETVAQPKVAEAPVAAPQARELSPVEAQKLTPSKREQELGRLLNDATDEKVRADLTKQIEAERKARVERARGEEYLRLADNTTDPELRTQLEAKAAELGVRRRLPEPEVVEMKVDDGIVEPVEVDMEAWRRENALGSDNAQMATKVADAFLVDPEMVTFLGLQHAGQPRAFERGIDKILEENRNANATERADQSREGSQSSAQRGQGQAASRQGDPNGQGGAIADPLQREAPRQSPEDVARQEEIRSDLRAVDRQRLEMGEPTRLELVPADEVHADLASKLAAVFKAPLHFVRNTVGDSGFNALTINGRVYINADGTAPSVALAVHEIGHNLPEDLRKTMVDTIMSTVSPAQRDAFFKEFPSYKKLSPSKQREELAMRIIEDDAMNPEFWSTLRKRLGTTQFGRLVSSILDTLDNIIAGFQKYDSSEFTTNIKRVREAVAEAYGAAAERKAEGGFEPLFSAKRPKNIDGPRVEPAEENAADRAASKDGVRVSPRMPTAVKATESGYGNDRLQPSIAAMPESMIEKTAAEFLKYPNFEGLTGTPREILQQAKSHMKDNLRALMNAFPKDLYARARMWYVGGNRIVRALSERYGVPPENIALSMASLSPQKNWFENVSSGERVIDIVVMHSQEPWSKAMTEVARSRGWFDDPKISKYVADAEGKTLRQMYDPADPDTFTRMAWWVRGYDEAHNPRSVSVITPEGTFLDQQFSAAASGAPTPLRWGSAGEISKAIQALVATTPQERSKIAGGAHKVRSFFNNIAAPYAKGGDVTVDTHAVAAALLRPLGGTTHEVQNVLSGGVLPADAALGFAGIGSSSITGSTGAYGVYADAYRELGEEFGMLPREIQSITWEAVRLLFDGKSKALKRESAETWSRFSRGEINHEQAVTSIFELAQGIGRPDWAREQPAAQPRGSSYRRVPLGGRPEFSERRPRDGGRREEAGRYTPLKGSPSVPGVQGPDPRIVEVAEQYAREAGIRLTRQPEYYRVDPERAARIADAYAEMRHAPQDPVVREAYDNLIKQTTAQYRALEKAGFKFWFIDSNSPSGAEYSSTPWNAIRDMRANQRMGVFPTNDGFGSDADFSPEANPLLADTGLMWPFGGPDGELRPVLANDLFRAVHDAFGHGMEGAGFRADGEENAWQAHARLFTGSALAAATSETRGQNSWVNFGPYGEQNQTASAQTTKYADQKTGLMPAWTWTDGFDDGGPDFSEKRRNPQTETPEFKRWFGDSRVVDKAGNPLVVYHGTDTGGFDTFKTPSGSKRGDLGIFTTPNREMASSYVRRGRAKDLLPEQLGEDADRVSGTYPVYLSLQNPWEVDMGGANFDGSHPPGTFEVYDSNGDIAYTEDGREFMSLEEAQELADTIGGTFEEASPGQSTDGYVREARAMGFDGAIIRNVVDDGGGNSQYAGEPSDVYVAFKPEQIKSAIGNSGAFDPKNPSILASEKRRRDASPLGFYSQLTRAAEAGPGKGTAQAWKDYFKGQQSKGVKADEIEWSGVSDWLDLQPGSVSRDQVVDFLKNNGVQVEETVLGGKPEHHIEAVEDGDGGEQYHVMQGGDVVDTFDTMEEAEEARDHFDSVGDAGTKYASYTVPGGTNYREVLLTMPERGKSDGPMRKQWAAWDGDEVVAVSPTGPGRDWVARGWRVEERMVPDVQGDRAGQEERGNYRSSHWDQPNILAHMRVDDRVDADGNKVLFVNEIQSDWGQEGKKRGFAKPIDPQRVAAAAAAAKEADAQLDAKKSLAEKAAGDIGYWTDKMRKLQADPRSLDADLEAASDARVAAIARKDQLAVEVRQASDALIAAQREQQFASVSSGAPRAPFVGKTDAWVALAIKRLTKMAVDGGYDKVAFISGDQAADLYDLSKQVETIWYRKSGDDNYKVEARVIGGSPLNIPPTLDASGIENYVGKELAKKIVETATGERQSISGDGLKVGGEGMKAFYDKIVPNVAKDVLRKAGRGRVEQVQIASNGSTVTRRGPRRFEVVIDGETKVFGSEESAREYADRFGSDEASQIGFEITPEIRAALADGQPLFSERRAAPAPTPQRKTLPFLGPRK